MANNHPNRGRRAEAEEERLPATTAAGAIQVYDFGDDADAGADDVGLDDRITPLLRTLHYQCPQIDRHDQQYVSGAQPGMIYNIATREVFDGEEGIDVVVCGRRKRYQRWIPRNSGAETGGFRGFMEATDEAVHRLVVQHGRFKPLPWVSPQGEDEVLVETGEMFVLYAEPPLTSDNARRAIVNFQSASLSNRYAPNGWGAFNSRVDEWRYRQPDGDRKRAPVWALRWRLRSQRAENKQGKFFVWSLTLSPPAADTTFAESFKVLVGEMDPVLYEMARDSFNQYRDNRIEYRPERDDDAAVGPVIDPDRVPF